MIVKEVKDLKNVDCYGIHVPRNRGGMWLKEDKVISTYELEFVDIFEFKEDEKYSAIMDLV